MERELAQGRVTVVGTVTTDHGIEVLEPLAACQRNAFDFLFQEIGFVKYQEEVHVLEDWMSDNAFEEFLGEQHLVGSVF